MGGRTKERTGGEREGEKRRETLRKGERERQPRMAERFPLKVQTRWGPCYVIAQHTYAHKLKYTHIQTLEPFLPKLINRSST